MASDGQVIIDLLFPGNKREFHTDVQAEQDLLNRFGTGTGKKMDEDFQSNSEKVKKSAKGTKESVDTNTENMGNGAGDKMGSNFKKNTEKMGSDANEAKSKVNSNLDGIKKEVRTKLLASAEEAGIKNFRSLLAHLPKEEVTRLEAKVQKGEEINWREEMSRMPKEVVTKMKLDGDQATVGLSKLKEEADNTGNHFHRLRDIIVGSFVGQMISQGVRSLITGLKDATQAGMEYNKEQDTMKTVWTSLTERVPKDGKVMVDYINQVSQHSIYSADSINKMAQSFYHVGSSVPDTKKWINDFVAVGSTMHMTGDQVAEAGEMFAKMQATGKASAEDIQVMVNRFPMFADGLEKATGKSMKQIYALSAAGKLSSADLGKAMDYLGQKYKSGTDEAMTSFMGMGMFIKSRWQTLWGDITNTSFNMSKKARGDIRDLLSDDMLKKYANSVSAAISSITGWVTTLLDYINNHKTTIIDIIGNMKTLVGIIGQTAWKTFIDFVYDIAKAFGLVSDKGKGTADPLQKIDDILKALIKHKSDIETLTKVLIAFFMIKKANDFLGSLTSIYSTLKNISGINLPTSLFGGTTAKAATIGAEGSGVAATTGTGMLAKVGASSLVRSVPVVAGGYEALQGLTHNSTVGGKTGGVTGAVAGTAAGAALGSLILPGIGTALGASAGSWVGEKFGSGFGKSVEKSLKGHPVTAKVKVKTDVDADKLSKSLSPTLKKMSKTLVLKMNLDPKSITQTQNSTNKMFNDMSKTIDKYYKNKEAKSKKDLDQLVKNGVMTQKQEDAALKKEHDSDEKARKNKQNNLSKMQKDTNNYYGQLQKIQNGGTDKLEKIAQKYGKNSKKYQSEQNKEMRSAHRSYINTYVKDEYALNSKAAKSANDGAKEQKSIYQQLIKDKGKLSLSDLKATQNNANKKYDAEVKPAQKTRDDVKDAAEDKYKSTKSTAEHEYKDLGTISKSQYKDIVAKAQQQRDDTDSAADDQYKKVTRHATEQHKKVTTEIDNQKKDVTTAAWQQSGAHGEAASAEMTGVNKSYSGGFDSFRGIWNGIIGGINSVLNALHKGWGKIPKMKAHANGSAGLGQDELALVGEEGFELAHDSQRGIYALGSDGPEIRHLKAGTSILPHSMSKKFLEMASMIPHHKDGVVGSITGAYDWVKDKIKDVSEFVEKGAGNAFKWVADKIGLDSFINKFTAAQYSFMRGTADLGKDKFTDYIKGFFEKYDDDFGGSASNPGGSGVTRWKDTIKKAAAKMHVDLTGAGMNAVLRRIAQESNGNPTVTNNWDSNAKAGTPSKGLLQYIQPTLNSWVPRGVKADLSSGYAQLVALFNDSNWLRDISVKGGWGPTGHKRFANGGFADQASIFGEDGLEAATPLRADKADVGYAMLGKTAAYMAARDNLQEQSGIDPSSLQNMMNKMFDKVGGDQTINIVLDGNTIAKATYPKIKSMQMDELTLSGVGAAIPVGGGY